MIVSATATRTLGHTREDLFSIASSSLSFPQAEIWRSLARSETLHQGRSSHTFFVLKKYSSSPSIMCWWYLSSLLCCHWVAIQAVCLLGQEMRYSNHEGFQRWQDKKNTPAQEWRLGSTLLRRSHEGSCFCFFLSTRFGTEEVSPHSGETPSRSCFRGWFLTPKRG